MLVVAGKFDMNETLRLIDQNYSKIANPPEKITNTWTDEPVQDGPRFVEIRREGSQASVSARSITRPRARTRIRRRCSSWATS